MLQYFNHNPKNLLCPSKPWEMEFRLSMLPWDNSSIQSIVLMSFNSKLTALGSTFNKSESNAQVKIELKTYPKFGFW